MQFHLIKRCLNVARRPTTVALLVALTTVALPDIRGDDKEEKDNRKKLEQLLAEVEPNLEKEEWAVKAKQYIADLRKQVENAEQIEVFQLNHKPLRDGKNGVNKSFHGYAIVSGLKVESKEQRKQVSTFLMNSLHWNELRMALCFNPRHGLRAVSGKQTLDFLICFECNRIQVFEGEQMRNVLATVFVDDNMIDKMFRPTDKKPR